jgi:large subunit ribosomal protein L2
MGKTITQQARGRGGPAFRVRKKAYVYEITYPPLSTNGKAKILRLINSAPHSAPLAKIIINDKIFYSPAADGIYESQEIEIEGKIENGNIIRLKDIPTGTKVFNVEKSPGNGGKILRSGGSSGIIMNKEKSGVELLIKRRKLMLNENCRATIGVAAGDGRLIKPLVRAGKRHHIMKSVGRKWHRTSPIKTNALDHPFGGGRGKRIKSKIAKRNAPPGKKVGHIRPRRTGRSK